MYNEVRGIGKERKIEQGLYLFMPLASAQKCSQLQCGRRGGYMELTNIDPLVRDQFLKRASISLCPNVQASKRVVMA